MSDAQAAAKRILERDKGATRGVWRTHHVVSADTTPHTVVAVGLGRYHDATRVVAECDGSIQGQCDAEAIAAFRSDAPVVARAYQEAIEALSELASAARAYSPHPQTEALTNSGIAIQKALIEARRVLASAATPTKENE